MNCSDFTPADEGEMRSSGFDADCDSIQPTVPQITPHTGKDYFAPIEPGYDPLSPIVPQVSLFEETEKQRRDRLIEEIVVASVGASGDLAAIRGFEALAMANDILRAQREPLPK